MMPIDAVTISADQYKRLVEDSLFLDILYQYGVDNWDGYCDAREEFHNRRDNEESKDD